MQPFRRHRGRVALLDRANVDTDQIIPKQFLKRLERTGFGEFLFFDWRYDAGQQPRPDFSLHRPEAAGATILLTRRNFGSGSSREHAVWALVDYGFRAVIAPSFADIFYNNATKNGLLPIALPEETVEQLFQRAGTGKPYELDIDLESCRLFDDDGLQASFEVEPYVRTMLLNGWDEIELTLQYEDRIAAYERARGMVP